MSSLADVDILQRARELYQESGRLSAKEAGAIFQNLEVERIQADGSSRRFWRLRHHEEPLGLLIAPAGDEQSELAESRSVWKIGRHLFEKGVPVPELFAWDSASGILLCEDLGNLRLHDYVHTEEGGITTVPSESSDHYYRETIRQLAKMQIHGAVGLEQNWCWDQPSYDAGVMVERESGYFLRAFWQGVLHLEIPVGVIEEFCQLAERADLAPGTFFLHRDFQSRNIMIKDGTVRFIDFQAGRFGPLGYDIASLLIDPYVQLSPEKQENLLNEYIEYCKTIYPLDEKQFKDQYSLLALHRNLQIVGAFSFLSKVKNKQFFGAFIGPALLSLHERLKEPLYVDYPLIRSMINKAVHELKQL